VRETLDRERLAQVSSWAMAWTVIARCRARAAGARSGPGREPPEASACIALAPPYRPRPPTCSGFAGIELGVEA